MVDAPGRRVFVGRGIELERLHDLLADVARGRERIVILAGEAGIGKSRLLERFTEAATEDGARVLRGRCLGSGNQGIPYAPFVEILRQLVRQTPPGELPAILGPGRAELTRLLPELAVRAADMPDVRELDRASQARLFEVILGVFQRLAQSSPVVVLIEDAHNIDRSARDLLDFLTRTLGDSLILFVLGLRTDVDGSPTGNMAFVSELQRERGCVRIDLGPLGRAEVAALAAQMMATAPRAGEIDRLVARSDGNPFYVEELVRAGALDDHAVPSVLSDVLAHRIGSLSEPVREVLRVAAIAGRIIDDDLLASVLAIPVRALGEILREAVESGILIHRAGHRGHGVEFRHSLLREVVIDELFPAEQVDLHAAVAVALEARSLGVGGVAPAEIALHWEAARRPDRALEPMIRAAEAAEHVYAFDEARRLWSKASALAMAAPTAAEASAVTREVLLARAADSALLAGEATEAIELGEAAIGAVDAGLDPARAAHLQDRLRWYRWEAGDRQAAAAAVEAALREIAPDPPSISRARALAQHAGILLYAGEYEAAAREAHSAIEVARAAGGVGEEALALGVLGWCLAVLGDFDAGIAVFREGRAIAERLGSVEGIALAAFNLASLLDRIGRSQASLDAAADGYATTERLGVARAYGGLLLGFRAKAEFRLGRWDAADRSSLTGLHQGATGRAELWLAVNRARLLIARGDFAAGSGLLTRCREIEEQLGGTEFRGLLLLAEAELAAWEGRLGDLRAIVDGAIPVALKPGPPDPALAWLAVTLLRAEADAAANGTAPDVTDAGPPLSDQLARIVGTVAESGGMADAAVGLLEAERARLDNRSDPVQWARTAVAFTSLSQPYPAAYARFREAEAILASRGSRPDAILALRTAAAGARDLGARPLLDLVERLAHQARISLEVAPAAEPRTDDDMGSALGLTAREGEVLRLVAGGWSNQQIADELFITRKTASVHVSNLMAKLGAQGRAAVAASAHRLGLVQNAPPPPDAAG